MEVLQQRVLALVVLAAVVAVGLAAILPGRDVLTVVEVPSYWDDITMTCRTARLEQRQGALEVFRCRAVDGGTLPPGTYRSPGTRWFSDITQRAARSHEIEISPDGELTGWASY